MPERGLYPRYAAPRLKEALADSPVVLIRRQSGRGYAWDDTAAGQRVPELFDGEFAILKTDNPTAFAVPPHAPHGQAPKLGTLHTSLMRAAETAHRSAVAQRHTR